MLRDRITPHDRFKYVVVFSGNRSRHVRKLYVKVKAEINTLILAGSTKQTYVRPNFTAVIFTALIWKLAPTKETNSLTVD
jgi:hypothetical protein